MNTRHPSHCDCGLPYAHEGRHSLTAPTPTKEQTSIPPYGHCVFHFKAARRTIRFDIEDEADLNRWQNFYDTSYSNFQLAYFVRYDGLRIRLYKTPKLHRYLSQEKYERMRSVFGFADMLLQRHYDLRAKRQWKKMQRLHEDMQSALQFQSGQ